MSRKLRLAYLAHSFRSDWNNGNAHFLRGLMRSMVALGHDVTVFEPESDWSLENLRQEAGGERSLRQFAEVYPELKIATYDGLRGADEAYWRSALDGFEVVVLHEWNPLALAHVLLQLRDGMGFKLLFHDTHHRASSSPEQIKSFGTDRFDGVVAFGEALSRIYRERFGMQRVWTLHEAADITVFHPKPERAKTDDVVWVGNWGDNERSNEIREFLLEPAAALRKYRFTIHGVRYPEDGLRALEESGVRYAGYLPNLDAPDAYAAAKLTVHIPRQQYTTAMTGIPTIRVLEALACGIPLLSAPWADSEELFREGDFVFVENGRQMKQAMEDLLSDEELAASQALRGLETVLARHTCLHRAEELSSICEDVLQ